MSYFIFGSFNSNCDSDILQKSKEYSLKRCVNVFYNNEINFFDDIFKMCKEQSLDSNIIFLLTSKNQPLNSEDLLMPFDKYSNEELFSDETRQTYKNISRENLDVLFDCLRDIMEVTNASEVKIAVTEGYDNEFEVKRMTLQEMKNDISNQVADKCYIDSIIYRITPNTENASLC